LSSGLLATGIFIAREVAPPLGPLPANGDVRARRADTVALARESDPLPASESVMTAWAHLVDDCRRVGVHRTVRLTDALIAATAVAHGMPVVTQAADFDQMANAHHLLRVVKV